MGTPTGPQSRAGAAGTFCWLDLAASDLDAAQQFYRRVFGWNFRAQPALGGVFTRAALDGRDLAVSLYPLRRAQLEQGVPSHWTPYVQVPDVEVAVRGAQAAGGRTVIAPLEIPGIARIAVVQDAVGALVGLWQA